MGIRTYIRTVLYSPSGNYVVSFGLPSVIFKDCDSGSYNLLVCHNWGIAYSIIFW